jgi:hypothetical protein
MLGYEFYVVVPGVILLLTFLYACKEERLFRAQAISAAVVFGLGLAVSLFVCA